MQAKHKANEMGEILTLGQPQRIQTASVQIQQHKIRLNGDITEPESFTDELNVIENLGENDSATIVINTNGGHLDSAVEFCSAIIGTEGYVHSHISGCAHSAGSMIFLKCHSYSVSPYATMLIHSPSGGFVGKFSDTFAQAEHFKDWTYFFYKDVYQDFLTEEELEKVIDGKDMWLNASQIEERLERMIEIRTARMEAEAEEQAEAFIEAELEGCEEYPVEDTSGHEYQLGSGLNKSCVNCQVCTCEDKDKSIRAEVGVRYDWDGSDEFPENLRKGDRIEVYFKDHTCDYNCSSEGWDWDLPLDCPSAIIAYRLIKPVEDKGKNIRAEVGVKYDWDGSEEFPENLRKGDSVKLYFHDGGIAEDDNWYWRREKVWGDVIAYELVKPVEETDPDGDF